MKIYEIKADIEELLLMLDDEEFYNDEDLQETFNKKHEELVVKKKECVDNYVRYIKNIEHQTEAVTKEIDRLRNKKKSLQNRTQFLKKMICDCMEEGEKIKSDIFNISCSSAKSVEILDEEEVPMLFKETKEITNLNKSEIRKALLAGSEIPGAKINSSKFIRVT